MDNSATTRCSERAKNKMVQILTEDYGNPSSLHNMGKTAEDYIKEAKEQIAKTLRCDEKEIVFTSGGTESNNMALIGGALANKRQGKHIITTAIEHASVQAPLAYLKELGYEITELSVDHDGIISLEELRDAVREDTVLVSIMMVNNEIGAVEPVEEAAKVIKAKNPDTLFHVDAIQAYGKFRICPKKMGIDLLLGEWTQDPRTERNRIFIYPRQGKSKTDHLRRRSAEGNALRHGECSGRGCTRRGSGGDL